MTGRPVFAPGLLAGKVALVTGGGTGIGFGIASCLAQAGAAVAIASRKPEHLDPAVAELRGLGPRALAVADRGYVLELGRNRFEGTGEALLADPEVKRLYLGG